MRRGVVRYGVVRYGMVRYGVVRSGVVRYGVVRCGVEVRRPLRTVDCYSGCFCVCVEQHHSSVFADEAACRRAEGFLERCRTHEQWLHDSVGKTKIPMVWG